MASLHFAIGARCPSVPQRRASCGTRSAPGTCRSARQLQLARTVTCSAAQAPPSSPLASVSSEEQLFAVLKGAAAAGKIPERLLSLMEDLYHSYKSAVLGSGVEGADEAFVAKVMASVAQKSLEQVTHPYQFQSFHQRILEPYNYYEYGQAYIRGLVDFDDSLLGHAELFQRTQPHLNTRLLTMLCRGLVNFKDSLLGHAELFQRIQDQLDAGENCVMLANHQTEADPAVWALMLEAAFPRLATDVIYVAGDRVITDALCKPFSMGRNLFCVHSKEHVIDVPERSRRKPKHMDDFPELKSEKQAMNRRTLKAMQTELKAGGKLLWIAPSGGRDRSKDPQTGEFLPDPFDPAVVELMRALITKSPKPGHLYPLAMYSYKIMPPPASLEKTVGERRVTNHAAVGVSVCSPLDIEAILADVPA
ncbi:hypothetical protein N2152v2_002640, partial [Parachlorella kessleri]